MALVLHYFLYTIQISNEFSIANPYIEDENSFCLHNQLYYMLLMHLKIIVTTSGMYLSYNNNNSFLTFKNNYKLTLDTCRI